MRNLYILLFITTGLSLSGQSVTFQSYMETKPWVEQVLLNNMPLVQSIDGIFNIPPDDVLPGKNILKVIGAAPTSADITSLDLLTIRRILLEVEGMNPTSYFPSDVDNSGYLGITDLILLVKKILELDIDPLEYKFVHSEIDLNTIDPF
ncbi:MAG: hypothetical protein AAGA77_16650, partial [Bacteroidota bacterium]